MELRFISDLWLYPNFREKVSSSLMICAERGVLITAPLQNVWGCLLEVRAWPDWMSQVQAVELLESPKVGAMGQLHFRSNQSYPFRIVAVEREHLLAWQRDFMWGTTLVYSYRLTRNAEGTILTLDVHCAGLFEKPVAWLNRRYLFAAVDAQLSRLKMLCEATFPAMASVTPLTPRAAVGARSSSHG